jgi:hypothetical protein
MIWRTASSEGTAPRGQPMAREQLPANPVIFPVRVDVMAIPGRATEDLCYNATRWPPCDW